MADAVIDLLKAHFRQLRLPTMKTRNLEKLGAGRRCDQSGTTFNSCCVSPNSELGTRAANAIATRIKNAGFPVLKDLDTFDFRAALPQLSKPKILELGGGEWIEHKYNCCLVGSQGTGKTYIAIALGQAALPAGSAGVLLHGCGAGQPARKARTKQYTLDKPPRPTGAGQNTC